MSIFETILIFLNMVAFSFGLCVIAVWHRRMEGKLDEVNMRLEHEQLSHLVNNANTLYMLLSVLVEHEQYEEAEKVRKMIKNVEEDIKKFDNVKVSKL